MEDYLVTEMVSMGFDKEDASRALKMTGYKSLELAIDFITASTPKMEPSYDSTPKYTKMPATLTKSEAPVLASSTPNNNSNSNTLSSSQDKKGKGRELAKSDEDNTNSYGSYNDEDDDDDDTVSYEDSADEDAVLGISHITEDDDEDMGTRVLASSDIQKGAAQEIERIASVIETSLSTAGALLRHFHWNSEKLLERYYEDPARVLKEAGIAAPGVLRSSSSGLSAGSVSSSVSSPKKRVMPSDCDICGDTLIVNKSSTLACGHWFCNDCWCRYLSQEISEGKSIGLHCMAHKCACIVPENIVRQVVPPAVFIRYTEFITKSFVEDNPNIAWCPRAGCQNAVQCNSTKQTDVQCQCGFQFCFQCMGAAHGPATCDMMKKWNVKSKDDSETCNWISVNTQDCPKCKSAIEKNGGCNHMTCRKCHYEFCWICGGDWKGHSNCNKFKGDAEQKDSSRAALERYLHYFHRYNSHEQSQKLEGTLRDKAINKMQTIQENDPVRWVDVQYILNSAEQLIECRRALKFTYVFAFYLQDGSEKALFEFLQNDLETTTEGLSGALESPVGADDPRKLKNLRVLANKKLRKLFEGVQEGLTGQNAEMGDGVTGERFFV